jgi:signal transduction histidine kinase
MVWNWLRRHSAIVDGAIVLLLSIGYVADAVHRHHWFPGIPLALAAVVPLFWRRHHPVAVLALVTALGLVLTLVYDSDVPVAPAVAIYTVAAHVNRRRSAWTSGIAAVLLLAAVGATVSAGQMIPDAIFFAAAWMFGDSLGARRAYTRELEEKAERLEREREAEAARAVAEEQARIGRELHDVIAHNLSVIVVQAAAANDVFEARPDRAREALREIEATGRGALSELRHLLGAVRDGADFSPQRGLERLDDLVAQVRTAGLDVSVSVEGDPRPLGAGVDLSAYRVVQEALTNTLKHAQATKANIVLRYTENAFDVQVHDDGRGNGDGGGTGTGTGIIGMRERVTTYGGSLAAGPAPDGGFAVTARFPL